MRAKAVWIGLLVSVVCLGAFVWNAEWAEIGRAFGAVDVWLVALAALWILASMVARAWRWRYLLDPARPPSFRHRLTTTYIGFMGNSIFPGRLGEPLRCFLLSKLEPQVAFASALATIVVERVFDLAATLVALIAFVLAFAPAAAAPDARHADLFAALRVVGWIFAAGLGAAGAILLLLAQRPATVRALARHAERLLPARLATRVDGILASFLDGLAGFRSWRALAGSLLSTAAVWASILLNDYYMLRAFGFDLGLVHALGLMVVLCFAVALPQAPGYLGVFQVASEQTLVGLYGVEPARAQAFAIALWACHVVPIVAAGAVALWIEGLSMRDVRRGSTAVAPADDLAGARG